jgi:hypothetical protein
MDFSTSRDLAATGAGAVRSFRVDETTIGVAPRSIRGAEPSTSDRSSSIRSS